MAVLAAYFDDSGSDENSPHFIVGGYIAYVDQWKQVSKAWEMLVRRAWGLEWFHMVCAENMTGPAGEKRNDYGWDWETREARVSLLGDLVSLHTVRGIACSLDRELWRKHVKPPFANSPEVDQLTGFPYLMPYTGCLVQILVICKKHGIPLDDVEIVFAEQKKDGPRARDAVRRIHSNFGLRDPQFGDMQELAPLQCADIIAWLSNKVVREGDAFNRRDRYKRFLQNLPRVLELNDRWLIPFGKMLRYAADSPTRLSPEDLDRVFRDAQRG